jgi:serine/threonine protein kinase
VPLYNAFYEEARVYMVLEFMDGGSIERLIAAHPSTPIIGRWQAGYSCKAAAGAVGAVRCDGRAPSSVRRRHTLILPPVPHAGGVTDERCLAKIAGQMLNGLNYLHRQHHQVHSIAWDSTA